MKRKGGQRKGTRALTRKNVRGRGKLAYNAYFKAFKPGDRVTLLASSDVQNGLYWIRRYYGKIGTILAKRGRCYEIEIYDRNKRKIIIAHPVHLKLCQS